MTETSTIISTRTLADYEDAVDAEKLVRDISARLRDNRGREPAETDHAYQLTVARLVRIGQRATVAADTQSRTRTRSPLIAGAIYTRHPDGVVTIGFCDSPAAVERGECALILRRGKDRWNVVI